MKNISESISVFFVIVLSLAIVYLIVQYNMIEEENIMDDISYEIPKQVTTKTKRSTYLDSLEGYGDDQDVKVDATKEDTLNKVIVKSELNKNELGDVVEDKTKTSYMKNLEEYADNAKKEHLDETKPVNDNIGEPQKLENDEIVDEIGMAIDAALDGI